MADPGDMVMPMLREMRAEIAARFDGVDARFDILQRRFKSLEDAQTSFKHALTSDTLLSRIVTGEFEGGTVELERKVRELEARP